MKRVRRDDADTLVDYLKYLHETYGVRVPSVPSPAPSLQHALKLLRPVLDGVPAEDRSNVTESLLFILWGMYDDDVDCTFETQEPDDSDSSDLSSDVFCGEEKVSSNAMIWAPLRSTETVVGVWTQAYASMGFPVDAALEHESKFPDLPHLMPHPVMDRKMMRALSLDVMTLLVPWHPTRGPCDAYYIVDGAYSKPVFAVRPGWHSFVPVRKTVWRHVQQAEPNAFYPVLTEEEQMVADAKEAVRSAWKYK
jgi:hypothetical protein